MFGLQCAADGCPVAVEGFDGDVGGPTTLAAQIEKLKRRFGLDRVVLPAVGTPWQPGTVLQRVRRKRTQLA